MVLLLKEHVKRDLCVSLRQSKYTPLSLRLKPGPNAEGACQQTPGGGQGQGDQGVEKTMLVHYSSVYSHHHFSRSDA